MQRDGKAYRAASKIMLAAALRADPEAGNLRFRDPSLLTSRTGKANQAAGLAADRLGCSSATLSPDDRLKPVVIKGSR
jgi:hypothetical protein